MEWNEITDYISTKMKLSRCDKEYTYRKIYRIVINLHTCFSLRYYILHFITFTAVLPNLFQQVPIDPCASSPCGFNSLCQNNGGSAACSCLPSFIGMPPNCRPECVINSECPSSEACIRQSCRNPCLGSCGTGAQCHVLNHIPVCTCQEGYTGDPFTSCLPQPRKKTLLSWYSL